MGQAGRYFIGSVHAFQEKTIANELVLATIQSTLI